MRVLMLRGTGYNGQSLTAGEEYDIDDKAGAIFCQLGKARKVTPADVVEVREPSVRHRDPVVKRAAR